MQTVSTPLQALLIEGVQRFASCWLVRRTDGVTFRFTDHDMPLQFDDGQTQVGGGPFSVSTVGGHASGSTTINVGGMSPTTKFELGEQIRFAGHTTVYTINSATAASGGGVGSIGIAPALAVPVAQSEAVTQIRSVFFPFNSVQASARQRLANLRTRNVDVAGVLDDEALTHEDLRAGKYRQAEFTEFLVDWKFPHEGPINKSKYWMSTARFDGEVWQATLEGVARFLQQTIGRRYNRTCRHVLGNNKCGVNLATYTTTGTVAVNGVLTQRLVIKTDVVGANGLYDFGNLTWLTGANAGLKVEVREFYSTDGRIVLQLRTPFDIAAGDTFSLTQGCDKTYSTCGTKFSNTTRFGGFPFIPGSDKAYTTPDRK